MGNKEKKMTADEKTEEEILALLSSGDRIGLARIYTLLKGKERPAQ